VRKVYLALAALAAVVVYFTSDAINAFLGRSSTMGAIWLFAVLPLAAILTRPVIVAAQRGHTQRAIGIVYAVRAVRISFFFKSLVLWAVFTTFVITLIGYLYREAEMQAAAGVANWWYLTNLLVLLLHLIPGRFRLSPAKPVTVLVCGPPNAGKSTFIGLLPIEPLPRDWSVMPSEEARRLLLNVHARAKGDTEIAAMPSRARITFTRPRVWSSYIGTRPVPVDFIEVTGAPSQASDGIVLVLPATSDLTREVQRMITQKIDAPLAVLMTKSDLAPDAELPSEAREVLDRHCRTWRSFKASDRLGEPTELEGFSPKGFLDAVMFVTG
jgi:signal recognition particle receptor subunit beta